MTKSINFTQPESTWYRALPSPPRLMWRTVAAWRTDTHTHRQRRQASQYLLHSLSGNESNKLNNNNLLIQKKCLVNLLTQFLLISRVQMFVIAGCSANGIYLRVRVSWSSLQIMSLRATSEPQATSFRLWVTAKNMNTGLDKFSLLL